MLLSRLLGIPRGITAIIGSGGKTTAMYVLAGELSRRGTVICTTSTRILPPEHLPVYDGADVDTLTALLLDHGCLCVGSRAENGKLGASAIAFSDLAAIADFVLVEADGSRGLPMKAHLSHEPVIPPSARQVIALVGAEGFGQSVSRCAHRAERFGELSGLGTDDAVTPAAVAAVINGEGLAGKLFVNQIQNEADRENARELAKLVSVPVFSGALREGVWECLS